MTTVRLQLSAFALVSLLAAGCSSGDGGTGGGNGGSGGSTGGSGGSTGGSGGSTGGSGGTAGADGPADAGPVFTHMTGDAGSGQNVFRFETFGNEGFWTDAVKLPQGIVAAHLTPVQALAAGLSVNIDAIDATTKAAIAAELADAGTAGPLLNNPATTLALINMNAIIGVVVKDTNHDNVLDVSSGDKVGVACSICHAITDGSIVPSTGNLGGGSIGKEVDGPASLNLNVGGIFALAANSRALYPLLQLKLVANGNKSTGRAPSEMGITPASTEAEVDAYLSNPAYYPLGMFDDAPDGVGAPMHITPLFRTDLSAPFGSPGDIAQPENFANLVYTALLDATTLTTPAGKNFLMALGGRDAGAEISDNYANMLNDAGITGYPFVTASLPAGVVAGSEAAPVGVRVDSQKLLDMNAYTDSLRAPAAPAGLDANQVAAGRALFRQNCTTCHNVAQNIRVPGFVVAEASVFPAYSPTVLAQRPVELPFRPVAFDPIQDDTSTIYDNKEIIVEASRRGEVRGAALPLLLDLARKDRFLQDAEVTGLDSLLNPSRGTMVPHPFFISDATDRGNVIAFLKSLDDAH